MQNLKRALEKGKNDQLSLQHCIHNCLFCYRSTPQSTTGKPPAELFIKREFKTRMSLLKPSFTEIMQQKQAAQQAKLSHTKTARQFLPKQQVLVRNHRGGESVKWVPGSVVKVLGPVTYLVKVCGKLYKRHVNQLISSELQKPGSNDELFQTDVIIVSGQVTDDDSNIAVQQKQLDLGVSGTIVTQEGALRPKGLVKPPVRLNL